MIPLLIVDDEPVIRESIAAMLRKRYPDQFHLFLAADGQEALSLVSTQGIELLLADIKMPVMNGIELLHRLHSLRLQCDVIFISGFDDYSFVREAMKSGAVDYLLKPISEDELFAQIGSFLKRYAMRVPIHTARVSPEDNVYLQQYVLDKLFDGEAVIPESVLSELHLSASSTAVLLAAAVGSDESNHRWFKQIRQLLSPLLKEGCVLFEGRKQQMRLALCLLSSASQLHLLSNLTPDGTVCSSASPLRQAPDLLASCQSLLECSFFDLPAEDGPETYPYTSLISELTDAVCHLQTDQYPPLLHLLLCRVCAQHPSVDSLRQLLCAMIYAILQKNSAFVSVFSQMELTSDDIIRVIQRAPTAGSLYDGMIRIINLQISRVQSKMAATSDEAHIKRACDYILAHLTEDFSLADLAKHLDLHPSYVSNLFTKVRGTSFSRYRKTLRMEEACRLICESNDKFYLIGSKVGYPDPVSFARVFKEEIGCTPSEYRSAHAVHPIKATRR